MSNNIKFICIAVSICSLGFSTLITILVIDKLQVRSAELTKMVDENTVRISQLEKKVNHLSCVNKQPDGFPCVEGVFYE